MEELEKLKIDEANLAHERECAKDLVKLLSAELNVTRKRIEYLKKQAARGKQPTKHPYGESLRFKMFGKRTLNDTEIKDYNAVMQRLHRDGANKVSSHKFKHTSDDLERIESLLVSYPIKPLVFLYDHMKNHHGYTAPFASFCFEVIKSFSQKKL